MDVEQLIGSFVVEIGFRQAWPFLGLCDNRPTPCRIPPDGEPPYRGS
jgi:hypothetical protein